MQTYLDGHGAGCPPGPGRSPDDCGALLRMRDQQRADYEARIGALREAVLANNRTIAELKARIIHYRGSPPGQAPGSAARRAAAEQTRTAI